MEKINNKPNIQENKDKKIFTKEQYEQLIKDGKVIDYNKENNFIKEDILYIN